MLLPSVGCRSDKTGAVCPDPWNYTMPTALNLSEPDVETCPEARAHDTARPHTLRNNDAIEYWPLTLEDAIRIGLNNSRVLRDAGGRVLTNPTNAQSTYDPAIRETSPSQGTIAAESVYDTTYRSGVDWLDSNQFFNNIFLGGGANRVSNSALFGYNSFDKRMATGGDVSLSNITSYDNNNAPGNMFNSLWSTTFLGTMTQPLMRGGGIEFNQIAGPSGVPGVYNGVLIARTNSDIALADLEAALRNYLLDTERAYWELYYAYHDLDAKIDARNAALELWRFVERKAQAGALGGDREAEARAREQYYLLQAQVENSLSGTTSVGGSQPVQGSGGVYVAERKLRLLLGEKISDNRLIRPSSDPPPAEIVFNWSEALQEALIRRVELRRQKTMIKRREMELIASRNFLKPKLDLVGTYALQGFGKDLLNQSTSPLSSAYGNLASTQNSHFSILGLQYSQAIGNRIGNTTVRNAELNLSREKAILAEQELQVAHELSAAIAEADRAYALTRTNFNRRAAAEEQLSAVTQKYDRGVAGFGLDAVLDAQRRLADAGSGYYRSVVDFNRALADVHYARGTLLDYNGVFLTEGPWPAKAYLDAKRLSSRVKPNELNYCFSQMTVSRQLAPQLTLPPRSSASEEPSLEVVPGNPAANSTDGLPLPEVMPVTPMSNVAPAPPAAAPRSLPIPEVAPPAPPKPRIAPLPGPVPPPAGNLNDPQQPALMPAPRQSKPTILPLSAQMPLPPSAQQIPASSAQQNPQSSAQPIPTPSAQPIPAAPPQAVAPPPAQPAP